MAARPLSSEVPDLIDRVGDILRETAEQFVLPRWRALADEDVRSKSPGELVTVADEEAERELTARLEGLAPDIPVVGEEATSADPNRTGLLSSDRAWLVDPIDGTTNFVNGGDRWSLMVALVEGGEASASWIWRPPVGHLYRAERGSGAYCNDRRLGPVDIPPAGAELRGSIFTRFFPPKQARVIRANAERHSLVVEGSCAGYDYPLLAEGQTDFLMFWRTLPWDHVPGSLLAAEAGADVRRIDGSAFAASSTAFGLLVSTGEVARRGALALLEDQPPGESSLPT